MSQTTDGRRSDRELQVSSLTENPVTLSPIANQTTNALALHLIQSGQWREAVYLIREESGANLSQAEAQIERLALAHGVHRYSRAFLVSMIALTGLTLFAIGGILQWMQ